ncbi:MAG: ATP-binding protein [Pseudomonadota bacterium]
MPKPSHEALSFAKRIRLSYVVALSLIALLASAAYLTLSFKLDQNATFAATINQSGLQRMLSQRTTLLAERLPYADRATRIAIRAELADLTTSMREAHDALTHVTGSDRVSLDDTLRALYFEGNQAVDPLLHTHLNGLTALVALDDDALDQLRDSRQPAIKSNERALLERLDEVVQEYERQSERAFSQLRQIERIVYAATLVTLLLEALLVFAPLVRSVRRDAQKLADRTEYLRRLYDTSPIMMWTMDTTGQIIEANNVFIHKLGLTRGESLTTNLLPMIVPRHDETSQTATLDWFDKMLTTRSTRNRRTILRRADGDLVIGLMSLKEIPDSYSSNTLLMCSMLDITEVERIASSEAIADKRLMLARQLDTIDQLAAELESANTQPAQTLTDHFAFLAESLRSLLIQLDQITAQTTSQQHLDDLSFLQREIPAAIEQTTQGVRQLRKIVMAMSTLSRPTSIAPARVDLVGLAESAKALTAHLWRGHTSVVIDTETAIPELGVDPVQISEVLLSMLTNAIQAIESRRATEPEHVGIVELRLSANDTHVNIVVSDNGCGMNRETLSRVFDPFFTTREVSRGAGRGLSAAHRFVVEDCGGDIRAESDPGYGSQFYVTLPLQSLVNPADDLSDAG